MTEPPLPLALADRLIGALLSTLTAEGLIYLSLWLLVLAGAMLLPARLSPLPRGWAGKWVRAGVVAACVVLAMMSALGGFYGDV